MGANLRCGSRYESFTKHHAPVYQQEGVRHYVIVDPEECIAKIYRLQDGRYIKVLDAGKDTVEFDLGKCTIPFEFAKIWL